MTENRRFVTKISNSIFFGEIIPYEYVSESIEAIKDKIKNTDTDFIELTFLSSYKEKKIYKHRDIKRTICFSEIKSMTRVSILSECKLDFEEKYEKYK